MTRRLAAAAVLAAALGGLVAAPSANAAACGPVLDYVAAHLPAAVQQVYVKVCGV
ncbi:MAG: hypothetical protein QOE45_2928 [Frankiaceae bacterium]|jgi:hypothetical protein|nr:hypothetical protein [Frankiaceae bacterium]